MKKNDITLYPYQEEAITAIFDKMAQNGKKHRLLFQLPTGGGKTVVFSEISRRFIEQYGLKVAVLTHRNELCRQTSTTMKKMGVANKVINSALKKMPKPTESDCYIAMVETLKNRIREKKVNTDGIGLVIIDEAHFNAFRKLLGKFKNAFVIGVTATPLSSDRDKPMRETYHELISGTPIRDLIQEGFLASPETIVYDVELESLHTGTNGDYTVKSSDALYTLPVMTGLLLSAYEEKLAGKKTLIFNNGIATSKRVEAVFTEAGYDIRHLDNHTPPTERADILKWFSKTKNAILTSVSILTTGFDEPTVEGVILNRATTSLTLYHQMIGRGSRRLPKKKQFKILDLGGNTARFGEWHEPVDWHYVFEQPEAFYTVTHQNANGHDTLPPEVRMLFPNSRTVSFDIEEACAETSGEGGKHKTVIRDAIRQHAQMCLENSDSISGAIGLAHQLDKEINRRVKAYAAYLGNTTKSYRDWLQEDYRARLEKLIRRRFGSTAKAVG